MILSDDPRVGSRLLQKPAREGHYRMAGAARHCRPVHILRAERALGKPLPLGAKVHHADGAVDAFDPFAPLVICQDEAYHKLLHLRMKIRAAGGNPNTDKVCSVCKQAKPLNAFGIDRQGPLGRQGTCKACSCAYIRCKYAENPELFRQRSRDHRAKLRSRL